MPSPRHQTPRDPSLTHRARPWSEGAAIFAILAVTVVALWLEGRDWWCDEGDRSVWISDVWSAHCSQHWLDPYSITHVSHGLIFWAAMALLARFAPPCAIPERWRLCTAIGIAAAWEVIENTHFVINRYRTVTMSLDYFGDSIANAVGDVIACGAGFLLARRIGWKWSLALFLTTEAVLLFWIRDNLTINVLMLLWPVRAIKEWQSFGHLPLG